MKQNTPLCRFCGKPMDIERIDHYDTWYLCSCDGYKKYQELQHTVSELKSKLYRAEDELRKHQEFSLYQAKLKTLEEKEELY